MRNESPVSRGPARSESTPDVDEASGSRSSRRYAKRGPGAGAEASTISSAAAEKVIARRILQLEAEVAALLVDIPAARSEALRCSGRVGTTRAAAVDRLEASVAAAVQDPRPDPASVRAAVRCCEEAQTLRWRLAMSAVWVAYREAGRLAGKSTITRVDLVQEGLLGLYGAAKRFEPDLDIRFATYARWWVRAEMTRAIDQNRVVRLSASACEQLRNLHKAIRIHGTAGKGWSLAGVATSAGLETERARTLLGVGTSRSLEDAGDGDGPSIGAELADPGVVPPDEALGLHQDIGRLRSALVTALSERQRRILQRRYGIDQQQLTLAEVAAAVGLSRERVRQLEREALALLREAWGSHGIPRASPHPERFRNGGSTWHERGSSLPRPSFERRRSRRR